MADDPPLDYAKPTTPNTAPVFQLRRENAGAGVRWTLPADGAPVRRASQIGSWGAAMLFLAGVGALFASRWLGQDLTIRALSSAWIVAIVMALAAAHWRHIAGQPIVLEVQPEGITLFSPQQLWGRRKWWPARRVKRLRIHDRGNDLRTGKPIGMLYIYTRLTSYPIFNGLEVAELTDVAERIASVIGITFRR